MTSKSLTNPPTIGTFGNGVPLLFINAWRLFTQSSRAWSERPEDRNLRMFPESPVHCSAPSRPAPVFSEPCELEGDPAKDITTPTSPFHIYRLLNVNKKKWRPMGHFPNHPSIFWLYGQKVEMLCHSDVIYELATIGRPLSDGCYHCRDYRACATIGPSFAE